MSTKDTGNNKGTPSDAEDKGSFDDFTESFFSTQLGTSVNRLSSPDEKDEDEEDSSEDFGIAGDVDTIDMPLMPVDDGSDTSPVAAAVSLVEDAEVAEGSDATDTDVFNREAYDELLDELDAQGDVSDILEESSDEEPPLELVSNFRMNVKVPQENPAVTDSLLNEFSAELGEPLVESAGANPLEKQQSSIEDDLLDMAFEELGFGSDPLLDKDLVDDENANFLGDGHSDELLEELSNLPSATPANDPLLEIGHDETTEVYERPTIGERLDSDNVWGADNTLEGLVEDTFDGWVDPAMATYKPTGEQDYYQLLGALFLQESKLVQMPQEKQYLLAECARISAGVLREDAKALELFGLANKGEDSVLRNADLKLYADVAARSGQTRLYLDVLQQWALEREGHWLLKHGETSPFSFRSDLAMWIRL